MNDAVKLRREAVDAFFSDVDEDGRKRLRRRVEEKLRLLDAPLSSFEEKQVFEEIIFYVHRRLKMPKVVAKCRRKMRKEPKV